MSVTYWEINEYREEVRVRGCGTPKGVHPCCTLEGVLVRTHGRYDSLEGARTAFEKSESILSPYPSNDVIVVNELALERVEYEIDEHGDEEYIQSEYIDWSRWPAEISWRHNDYVWDDEWGEWILKPYYFPNEEFVHAFFVDDPICFDMAELKRLTKGFGLTMEDIMRQVHVATAEEIEAWGTYDG